MATNTGRTIAATYKNMLNIDNNNIGVDGSLRNVQDGEGTATALQLSQSVLNVNGEFQLNGVAITADASAINNITDLTAVTGLIATSGTNAYGRTLVAGSGVSITNADGTEGNPTIALNPSGVSAATYGPFSNITVNEVGQITSVTPQTSVSIAEFRTESLNAGTINTTGNVSIAGDIQSVGYVSATNIYATSVDAAKINSSFVSVSTLIANNLIVEGFGTSINSFIVNNLTVVSIGTIAGVSIANVNDVAAVSALTQTNLDSVTSINTVTDTINSAITSINSAYTSVSAALETRIAAVSALTSVNGAAITSVSAALETRIAAVSVLTSTNAADIASNSAAIVSVSAALETRIAAVSVLTSINTAAITSVSAALETRIAAVSVLTSVNSAAITSINSAYTSVSAALETRIAAVSALTSVNLAAITSVSAALETRIAAVSVVTSVNAANLTALSTTLATSIANHLPLTGGAISGDVSVSGTLDLKTNVFGQRTSLTDGVSIAIDMATGNHFIVQLGGNRTLAAPTNLQPTQTGSIIIIQDGTGSRTLSFNAVWDFPAGTAPTISTVSGTVDRIDFEVYTSTNIHAVATLDLQ